MQAEREIQQGRSAKAEALYRKVISGDRPLPLPGSQPGKGDFTWECYSCSRENSFSTQRCDCGYRSLTSEASRTGGAVEQARAGLYWDCSCGFLCNTRNVERCLKCGAVNADVAEEVKKARKPLAPIAKSSFSGCSAF